MANVFFKRGLHADLPQNGGVNGAFYLTTDTNRLYVCNSDGGPLVELNQSINTVAKMHDLPDGTTAAVKGQYYYITELNALAYHNGTDWVQINPTVTLKSKEQDTTVTVDTNTNGVTIEHDVEDSDGNHSKGSFTVIPGNNVTITKDGDGFKIDSSYVDTNDNTTYTIGAESITGGAQVNLNASADDADSAVKFEGKDAVTVGVDNDNITISAHDTKYAMSTATGSGNKNVKVALSADGTEQNSYEVVAGTNIDVKLVDGNIEISAAGAANMYNESVSLAFDEDGKLTVGVKDGASDDPLTANVTPEITYGGQGSETAKFEEGNAILDVYTTTEVDAIADEIIEKLQVADAMHYCGTIAAADGYNTPVYNGDTYKATAKFTIGGKEVQIGDLVIAQGTENNEGVITGTINWEVVSSGDSQVVDISVVDHTFTVHDNAAGADNAHLGSITVKTEGENIKDELTGSDEDDLVVTIKHDVPGANAANIVDGGNSQIQDAKSTLEIVALTNIKYDANGHIIEVAKDSFFVTDTDTHNKLEDVAVATAQSGDKAVTVNTSVKMTDGDTDNDTYTIESSSLKLVAGEKKVSIDLEWGSF